MPNNTFLGPTLKVERAYCHISELNREVEAFLGSKPYKLVAKSHENGIKLVIRVKKQIPEKMAPIIGDAIHNLRSALDILACDLVRLNGGNTKNVYFPIAASANDLETAIKERHVDRAAKDVVDIIRSLKPYKGGNDLLWAVHDLDITDKHKLLIPMAHFAGIPNLTVATGDTPILKYSSDLIGPLKEDMTIITLPQAGNFQLGQEFQATFEITFGQGQSFIENKPVITTLHQLADLIDGIIQAFKSHCRSG